MVTIRRTEWHEREVAELREKQRDLILNTLLHERFHGGTLSDCTRNWCVNARAILGGEEKPSLLDAVEEQIPQCDELIQTVLSSADPHQLSRCPKCMRMGLETFVTVDLEQGWRCLYAADCGYRYEERQED